jgi:hypothetical protein
MITSLLKWAYAMDVELWAENGKLKYRAEKGVLTDDVKQRIISNKDKVIKQLEENQTAKLKQWLTFNQGEMYSKQTAENSELFIFRNDDDTFTVLRASWKYGETISMSEKTIVDRVTFDAAMDRANNYYDWATNKKQKRKAS